MTRAKNLAHIMAEEVAKAEVEARAAKVGKGRHKQGTVAATGGVGSPVVSAVPGVAGGGIGGPSSPVSVAGVVGATSGAGPPASLAPAIGGVGNGGYASPLSVAGVVGATIAGRSPASFAPAIGGVVNGGYVDPLSMAGVVRATSAAGPPASLAPAIGRVGNGGLASRLWWACLRRLCRLGLHRWRLRRLSRGSGLVGFRARRRRQSRMWGPLPLSGGWGAEQGGDKCGGIVQHTRPVGGAASGQDEGRG